METKKQHHTLDLQIEGKQFEWPSQYITGAEVKNLARIDAGETLYLSITDPWEDELIGDADKVDLARPETEFFYVFKKLPFKINGQQFQWKSQYITGKQVRALGNIDADEDIYLAIERPYKDEMITDETRVDLARTGEEEFITKDHSHKEITLIVNISEKPWTSKTISYEEVVVLAFGSFNEAQTSYTVTYKRGTDKNPEGEMSKGDTVRVKNKMVFNVTPTDKS